MDMSMESTSQKTSSRSAVSKDMELQVCVCGWSKATTVRGLKIHQGRMKCLREKGQGPRIDQYFLRSQSSQSNEIQRQEANHSSQDISTPVIDVRRTCMDTVSDEPNDPCEPDRSVILADRSAEESQGWGGEGRAGREVRGQRESREEVREEKRVEVAESTESCEKESIGGRRGWRETEVEGVKEREESSRVAGVGEMDVEVTQQDSWGREFNPESEQEAQGAVQNNEQELTGRGLPPLLAAKAAGLPPLLAAKAAGLPPLLAAKAAGAPPVLAAKGAGAPPLLAAAGGPAGSLPLLVAAVDAETAPAALLRPLEGVVEPAGTLPLLVLVGTAANIAG
ncbi:UNVERIFIED_CONTAM: hypothetical protein FKN15_017966 [Acipenser sinensis]